MSRAGLIVNPRSGKSSGKGLALANMLLHSNDVTVKILDRFEQLDGHLNDMASHGVTDIFISSGDGTIQAIQTILAERQPFAQLPRLSLLPHGTTNMTAADLGFRHRSVAAQVDFIRALQPTDLRQRPTLRCANPRDGWPRHGMFLGTGAVSMATQFTQQAFNSKGIKGNWAVFATLAGAVGKAVLTAPNPHDAKRFDRPYAITLRQQDKIIVDGHHLLMLATTLDKLILGAKPFWGGKTAPIRATTLPYPLPSIPRWLIPAMYGSETRTPPPGAVSVCATVLEVTSGVPWVIDGEFFDGPANAALRIETGPTFTYVCG